MKKRILIPILICSMILSCCQRGHDAPVTDLPQGAGSFRSGETAAPAAQPARSQAFSIFMPSKTFMEDIQGEDSLYLSNKGISWQVMDKQDNENAAGHIIYEVLDHTKAYDTYMRPYHDTGFTYEEYLLSSGMLNSIEPVAAYTDMYVCVKPITEGAGCAAEVLTYALERLRYERFVPIDGTVYTEISYWKDDNGDIFINADIYDVLGVRSAIRNEKLSEPDVPTLDSSARSLYLMPHSPAYMDETGTYLSRMHPDPSGYDAVLPFVYSTDRSKRRSLSDIAESMPQIRTLYIPKGIDADISVLERLPLDTLYIDVSDMSDDDLTRLSRTGLDKLVMYCPQRDLSMFSDCNIPYIGVYMDRYDSAVASSAQRIPSLKELGIIAANSDDIAKAPSDLEKLSLIFTGRDISFLRRFAGLDSLDISSMSIDRADIIELLPLSSLTINCPECDISFISGMDTLKSLYVRNDCPDVSRLPLERLKVIYCDTESDKLFLPTLRELYISTSFKFRLDGIQACTSLEKLTLVDPWKGYYNDISPLADMDIPDLTLDILVGELPKPSDFTGALSTADDAAAMCDNIDDITKSDYDFICIRHGTDGLPDTYSFISRYDGMIPYFPALLERDGMLEEYSMIQIDYPSGMVETVYITDGRLYMDTSVHELDVGDNFITAAYLYSGDKADVYLYRD